jgi:glycine cleavage system H protein
MEIGWVEGFKASSDVYCVLHGEFAGGNPALAADACIVRSDPYLDGWLYAVRGAPEDDHLDVHGYIALLQETISRMAAEEHA